MIDSYIIFKKCPKLHIIIPSIATVWYHDSLINFQLYLEISCMLTNSTESGTPAGCAWPDMFLGWRTTLVLDLNPCFAMRDDPRTNDQVVDHYMHVDAIGTLYSLYSFITFYPVHILCQYHDSMNLLTYITGLIANSSGHATTLAKMWSLQTGGSFEVRVKC